MTATIEEILKQWEAVQLDRAAARACLERTGPGESPYSLGQLEAWNMREHCLARTLLASMPELEHVLRNHDDR